MTFIYICVNDQIKGRILNSRFMDGGEEGLCEKLMELSRAKKKSTNFKSSLDYVHVHNVADTPSMILATGVTQNRSIVCRIGSSVRLCEK